MMNSGGTPGYSEGSRFLRRAPERFNGLIDDTRLQGEEEMQTEATDDARTFYVCSEAPKKTRFDCSPPPDIRRQDLLEVCVKHSLLLFFHLCGSEC